MADNNVEIRITGSLDPSVATTARAAASELNNLGSSATVSAKAMSDALKAAGGDMSKVTPEMLGLATASSSLAPAATSAAVAIESVGHSAVNSRAATESLVIVHEALQGRMSRIPGSAMILTQALTGASGASLFLGAGVVALAAGLAYLGVKSLEAANAVDKLSLSGLGTQGFAASEEDIRKLVAEISVLPEVSSASAEKAVAAFQSMQNRSKASLDGLAAAVDGWAAETGQTTEKAAEQLSRVFGEPLSASASRFVTSLRGVTAAEIDAYNQARQAGDIYGAQRVILEALGNTIDQSKDRLVQHSAAVHDNWRNFFEYVALVAGGMTTEQAQSAMLVSQKKNWDDLSAAVHGATAELAKTQATPQQQLSRALIDADAVDTTRTRIAELKAKVAEFQEALANPGATEAMKANFTSAIAAAEKEIDSLRRKGNRGQAGPLDAAREQSADEQTHWQETHAEMLANEVGFWQAAVAATKAGTKEHSEAVRSMLQTEAQLHAAQGESAIAQMREQNAEISDDTSVAKSEQIQREIQAARILLSNDQLTGDQRVEIQRSIAEQIRELHDEQNREAQEAANREEEIWKSAFDAELAARREQSRQMIEEIQKTAAPIAQMGRAEVEQKLREYRELTSAEDTFTSELLSGRVGVLGALEAAGKQFLEKQIEDELHYLTAKRLFSQAELEGERSIGQQATIFHLGTELAKTNATAAGEQARVAAKTAGAAEGNATEAVADSASILNSAYTAAASAFKWVMQEVPFPANVIAAPVAAAGTFAAVSAFDAIQSFDVGTPYVPRDMIAQIHKGERIIPASQNNSSFGGDTYHLNLSHTTNFTQNTPQDIASYARTAPSEFAAAVMSVIRGGYLKLA